jgi:hypothetical protein
MNAMKHKQFSIAVLICFPLLAAFALSPAQNLSDTQARCSRIDQSRPAQFISYESVSSSSIRLRLHNNSNCPIIVETDDGAPRLSGSLSNIPLHYLVQDRRRQTVKPAYGWGDSVFTVEIRGGDSVTFIVSLVYFKRHLDVAAPFIYAWEGNHVGAGFIGGVNHYVYFLSDDLPAAALRQMSGERTRHNNSFNPTAS